MLLMESLNFAGSRDRTASVWFPLTREKDLEREAERKEALWRLAERLHETMERLDPSGIDWASLSEAERSLFYFAIKSVLSEYREVARVLEIDLTNNNVVIGSSVSGEQADINNNDRRTGGGE